MAWRTLTIDPTVWHVSFSQKWHKVQLYFTPNPKSLYIYFSLSINITFVMFNCVLPLQHPVSWQPSKEGDHLIGRITLSKRSAMPREAGSLLGLKVSRQWFTVTKIDMMFCKSSVKMRNNTPTGTSCFSSFLPLFYFCAGGWRKNDWNGETWGLYHQSEKRKPGRCCGSPTSRCESKNIQFLLSYRVT